jgi:hypothetical protein
VIEMTKGFLFLALGLVALLGVVGGIEQTVDISLFQAMQLFAVAMVGFASMILGVSYLKGE